MKIAVFDDYRIGAVERDGIHDLTELVPDWEPGRPWQINRFIGQFPELRPAISHLIASSPPLGLESVRLRAPVPRPTQLLAAPLNFQAHRDEMTGSLTAGPGTAAELGFFIKATGSITDPSSEILIPNLPGRRFDFEGEVAVVVGREAHGVPVDRIMDHVFGYTLLLDMTMRMTETQREERTMRKSFATFSPMGPWILTADEVPDPAALNVRAWRNGEQRQDAWLADLIVDIPSLLSRASDVLSLEPGDVYTTGSPAGVGEVQPGDQIVVESEAIGRLEMRVVQRAW